MCNARRAEAYVRGCSPSPPSDYASACSVHMTRPQCRALALARLVDLPKADNVHTHNITSFLPPPYPLPSHASLSHFHDTKCISCAALHFRVHGSCHTHHPAACRVSIAALIKINIFCTKPNRDQEQVPALWSKLPYGAGALHCQYPFDFRPELTQFAASTGPKWQSERSNRERGTHTHFWIDSDDGYLI